MMTYCCHTHISIWLPNNPVLATEFTVYLLEFMKKAHKIYLISPQWSLAVFIKSIYIFNYKKGYWRLTSDIQSVVMLIVFF